MAIGPAMNRLRHVCVYLAVLAALAGVIIHVGALLAGPSWFVFFHAPEIFTASARAGTWLAPVGGFVIAGLIDNSTTETISKIPGLANIPLLGKIFQSRAISKNNSELLVIVTPEVVRPIQAGQPLMALISLDDVWVTANFKETQLTEMRPGQRATVKVDAYGGREFTGHVDSIAAATGARFSLLPPENATGNYVKVVQRIPVKIVLEPGQDPDHLLRPGMSVVPTVYLK